MSKNVNGGVRGVLNTPTRFGASGRWSASEAYFYRAQNSWPLNIDPEILLLADDVAISNWGSSHFGGFLVGVMDTTQSNIIAADQWQTGLRYALIVSPKSYEKNSNLTWRTSLTATAAATLAFTRWNGLGATQTLLANQTVSQFPVFQYCEQINNNTATGLRGSPGDTTPSRSDLISEGVASEWYVPALDELSLIYWRFKPVTTSNNALSVPGGTFPGGTVVDGVNLSSEPTFPAFTSSVPGRTSVIDFRSAGAQALDSPTNGATDYRYWSSTEAEAGEAWWITFGSSNTGTHSKVSKDNANARPRLVRRVLLP